MAEKYSLEFIEKYSYAHNGIKVEHYEPGQLVETLSEDFYTSALKSGCAIEFKEDKLKKGKR